MRLVSRIVGSAIAALIGCVSVANVHAETVLSTSELLAATPAAQAALPAPRTFTVTTAGTYEIELADAGFPAPVTSLRAMVVHAGAAVAEVDIAASAAGTDTFEAVPGEYRIHVLGQPGKEPAGSYTVRIRAVNGGAVLVDEGGSVNSTATPSDTTFIALLPLTVTSGGAHTLTIADHQFPAALQSPPEAIVLQGSVEILRTSTFPANFSATPGEYTLSVRAEVAAGAAGLYGVRVQGPAGDLYDAVQQVGTVPSPLTLTLPGSGTYELVTQDVAFPQPLTSFKVLVVQGSQLLCNQSSVTPCAPFAASAGPIKVYSAVVPASNAGVGSIGLKLTQGGNAVYANVLIGDADPSPATPSIYAATSSALSAGTYRLHVKDFSFPATLSALRTAVAQGDALVDDWDGDGRFTFDAANGSARVLIAATPAASTGTGLFGIRLEPGAGGAAILETNQGVGGLFRSHLITLASDGSRDIELTDLGFPALLASSALAVTSGTELIGQVFGGGQLRTTLSAGTYVLNFLGKPDAAQRYGAYALNVADSPPPPALTFAANPASVTSGNTTTLQWTATDATSCTASGAWSGARNVNGSFVTAALNAETTFQLSCNGPGGSVQKSVTVQVTSRRNKSGGGGPLGVLDWVLLMVMVVYVRQRGAIQSPVAA